MPWNDTEPQATDILITGISIETKGNGLSVIADIDKLPDGTYRCVAGNLFHSMELARNADLEALLREVGKTRLSYKPERKVKT